MHIAHSPTQLHAAEDDPPAPHRSVGGAIPRGGGAGEEEYSAGDRPFGGEGFGGGFGEGFGGFGFGFGFGFGGGGAGREAPAHGAHGSSVVAGVVVSASSPGGALASGFSATVPPGPAASAWYTYPGTGCPGGTTTKRLLTTARKMASSTATRAATTRKLATSDAAEALEAAAEPARLSTAPGGRKGPTREGAPVAALDAPSADAAEDTALAIEIGAAAVAAAW
jgi:hypothetical protein